MRSGSVQTPPWYHEHPPFPTGLLQTQDRLERHMAATTHSQTAMLFPELELSPSSTSVGVGGVGGGGGYYG